MLFHREIRNWADWGKVYRDIPAFLPLAREIFAREGLPPIRETAPLTPGTNAVFRTDGLVAKIFAPAESGLDSAADFETERAAIRRAERLGLNAPKLRAAGYFEDRYRFYYLIMEWIPGMEAGRWLKTADRAQKERFCGWLREMLALWNTPFPESGFRRDVAAASLRSPRWRALSPAAEEERRALLPQLSRLPEVCVHGDLTAENLLVCPDGRPVVIDFADTVLAPACYELPPICLSLFDCDPGLAREFWRGTEPLADALFAGLLLHDFGADFIREICGRFLGLDAASLPGLAPVREFLERRFG